MLDMDNTVFTVSYADYKKIEKWLTEEIFPKIIAEQKKTFENPDEFIQQSWDLGYPYTGAIGGGLTYHFSPTGLGTAFTVTYLEHELDLTDYASW